MSFRPIIDRWGSKAELAADLKFLRVTVQQWWTRDSIPADWFPEIEAAAKRRGFDDITQEALHAINKAKRPPMQRPPEREGAGA